MLSRTCDTDNSGADEAMSVSAEPRFPPRGQRINLISMDFDGPVPGIPGAVIYGVDELPEHLADGEPAGQFSQAKPGQLLLERPRHRANSLSATAKALRWRCNRTPIRVWSRYG